MSAETDLLRKAAARMEQDIDDPFFGAVAGWLQSVALRQEDPELGFILGGVDWENALAVARDYLGVDR